MFIKEFDIIVLSIIIKIAYRAKIIRTLMEIRNNFGFVTQAITNHSSN